MPRSKIVVPVAKDDLSAADLARHRHDVVSTPGYDPSFGLLFDLRRVTNFSLTTSELRSHADRARRYALIAIAAPTSVGFGLSRLYQAHREKYGPETFGVFRSGRDAWKWLRERLDRH